MAPDHPFSRWVTALEVPPEGSHLSLVADAEERAALACLVRVPEIAGFTVELDLRPWRRGGLVVTGVIEAALTQVCVVSLEPFETALREEVEARYVPAGSAVLAADSAGGRRSRHAADLDAPDELIDGKADVGALAAEFLALGLDPYPRKPSVELPVEMSGEPAATSRPFAALAALRTRGSRGQK